MCTVMRWLRGWGGLGQGGVEDGWGKTVSQSAVIYRLDTGRYFHATLTNYILKKNDMKIQIM